MCKIMTLLVRQMPTLFNALVAVIIRSAALEIDISLTITCSQKRNIDYWHKNIDYFMNKIST